jgi:hypothetical protein
LKHPRLFFLLLFAVLLAARLCHVDILWAEETLPSAAAAQMLDGKVLYRDIWFDKPPLLASAYLLWGARTGWILRLAGAFYALLCCALAAAFARDLWSEQQGLWAAALMAFFLTFDIPSAVVPLSADMLMVAPHIAAVYLAWRGRPFWSGAVAGAAFLVNAKALFVLAACAIWSPRSVPLLALGFVAPNLVAAAWLWPQGALAPYYEQVWKWGRIYAAATFVKDPLANGMVRTANWMGFHAAAILAASWFWIRERQWRWAAWSVISLAAVVLGWRFFPRYFLQLLPVVTLAAARGFTLLGRRRALVLLALLIPLIRFGPRYVLLVTGKSHDWADVAMDRDSREAARLARQISQPGDTLLVWGFRPELYCYTGLPAATRFLDSQPLTGVPADRHLTQSASLTPDQARANRAELIRSRPTFIMDGLGRYNPKLAIRAYEDLRQWLSRYDEVGHSGGTILYKAANGRE